MVTGAIQITRPTACLGAAACVMLGSHLASTHPPWSRTLAAASAAFLTVAACNTVNDLTDIDADRRNRPFRPLPSGRLQRQGAAAVAACSAVAALAVAATMGMTAAILTITLLTAGVAYSLLVKRITILGHLWVAGLFGACVVWGGWSAGHTSPEVWIAGLIVALFILPREILKAIHDLYGDRAAGIRTAPARWGRNTALRLMAVAVALFGAVTLVPFVLALGGIDYVLAVWLGNVVPLFAITVWVWRGSETRIGQAENLTTILWATGLGALWRLG